MDARVAQLGDFRHLYRDMVAAAKEKRGMPTDKAEAYGMGWIKNWRKLKYKPRDLIGIVRSFVQEEAKGKSKARPTSISYE